MHSPSKGKDRAKDQGEPSGKNISLKYFNHQFVLSFGPSISNLTLAVQPQNTEARDLLRLQEHQGQEDHLRDPVNCNGRLRRPWQLPVALLLCPPLQRPFLLRVRKGPEQLC